MGKTVQGEARFRKIKGSESLLGLIFGVPLSEITITQMELQIIQNKIYEIRGQKVMLDFDLAELYATETRLLKRAVRRNIDRFPY